MAIAPGDSHRRLPDRTVRHRLGGEDLIRYALVAAFAAILYLFVALPARGTCSGAACSTTTGRFVGVANYARYFAHAGHRRLHHEQPARVASPRWSSRWAGLRLRLWAHADPDAVARALPAGRAAAALRALAGPGAGLHLRLRQQRHLHARSPDINVGIYGAKGIIVAEVFYCFPHALLILMAALAATDARLYDAARTLGASPLKTFLTVTLPGVKFGLVSACFVVFTLVITDFGAPKAIGGKFSVHGHRDLQPGLRPAELHHGRDGLGRAADPGRAGLPGGSARSAPPVRARDVRPRSRSQPRRRPLADWGMLRLLRGSSRP